MIGFLSQAEIAAVLNAPDGASWCGQRDRAMLATLYNTGARVSELIGMRVGDVVLERSASVRIHGKGRKERIVPLWRSTAAQIQRWLPRINAIPDQPLFPNRSSGHMTRSAVTDRLKLACKLATARCPQLAGRHISPHTFRHYLPFLTMSSNSGERSVSFEESWSRSRSAQAITRHSLLYLQTIEKAEELVSRFVAPWLAVPWGCLRKSLLLHCERCIEIDLRGFHRLMSEPQRNHRTFSACL